MRSNNRTIFGWPWCCDNSGQGDFCFWGIYLRCQITDVLQYFVPVSTGFAACIKGAGDIYDQTTQCLCMFLAFPKWDECWYADDSALVLAGRRNRGFRTKNYVKKFLNVIHIQNCIVRRRAVWLICHEYRNNVSTLEDLKSNSVYNPRIGQIHQDYSSFLADLPRFQYHKNNFLVNVLTGALMTCTASIYEPWLQIAQIPASCFVPCTNKDCSRSYPSWTYVMPFVPELGFPDLRQDVKPHTTRVPLNCWHSQTTTHAKLGSNCENDLIWVCSNKNSPATFQFSRAWNMKRTESPIQVRSVSWLRLMMWLCSLAELLLVLVGSFRICVAQANHLTSLSWHDLTCIKRLKSRKGTDSNAWDPSWRG